MLIMTDSVVGNTTTEINNGSHLVSTCIIDQHDYDITPAVIYGLCAAIGFVITFFGYRVYRPSLAIISFLFVTFLIYFTCKQHASHLLPAISIAISVCLGIISAIVSTLVQYIGQFIVGSQIGITVTAIIFLVIHQFVDLPSIWIPISVLIFLWLFFGGLTIKYVKNLFIISTSVMGAALMLACVDYFIEKSQFVWYLYNVLQAVEETQNSCWYSWLIFACWPFTFIIGIVIQLRVTAYKYDHIAEFLELKQRKATKINLQKLRAAAQSDKQQSHYRHLYQVRRVHGDVISQTFIKNVEEQSEKHKSMTPPPSTPTTLATDAIISAESAQTTLTHIH